MGSYDIDYGRLSNKVHCFFADVDDRDPGFAKEPGVDCELFSANDVDAMVQVGKLACIQDVALWHFAHLRGFVNRD